MKESMEAALSFALVAGPIAAGIGVTFGMTASVLRRLRSSRAIAALIARPLPPPALR